MVGPTTSCAGRKESALPFSFPKGEELRFEKGLYFVGTRLN